MTMQKSKPRRRQQAEEEATGNRQCGGLERRFEMMNATQELLEIDSD
jgi:hypothetical protein